MILLTVLAAWADCPADVGALPPGPYTALDPRLRGAAVVVAVKEARRIGLYRDGVLVDGACWPVALGVLDDGTVPTGPKRRRGDRKTPEGWYRTSDRPWSRFHGALTLSYPNEADADRGLAAGLIDGATRDRIV